MNFKEFRALRQREVASMDEDKCLCYQTELRQQLKNTELLLNDVQLRLDYLGVFTLANITKLARTVERKDAKKPEMPL